MSNLKHLSDLELVDVIQQGSRYRKKLSREIHDLEDELKLLKIKKGGSEERSRWAIIYLSGENIEC